MARGGEAEKVQSRGGDRALARGFSLPKRGEFLREV